jgi:hypothetical protein
MVSDHCRFSMLGGSRLDRQKTVPRTTNFCIAQMGTSAGRYTISYSRQHLYCTRLLGRIFTSRYMGTNYYVSLCRFRRFDRPANLSGPTVKEEWSLARPRNRHCGGLCIRSTSACKPTNAGCGSGSCEPAPRLVGTELANEEVEGHGLIGG